MIATFAFYLFASLAILSAVMVVFSRNPVHSVLWLIVTFFNAAGLMILLGAEFIAILVILVYVGAVAVLFLFIVMMLDIDFSQLRSGFSRNLPVGLLLALVLFAEMGIAVLASRSGPVIAEAPPPTTQSNIEAFGELLYGRYLVPFELSGLILLVALIGAVVLTHRSRGDARPQNIDRQNRRDPKEAIRMTTPESGKGVEL